MNLVNYDGLINHFTDLLQKYSEKANRYEDKFDTYCFGKAIAYLDVVNTLTELKNGGELPHEEVYKGDGEEL